MSFLICLYFSSFSFLSAEVLLVRLASLLQFPPKTCEIQFCLCLGLCLSSVSKISPEPKNETFRKSSRTTDNLLVNSVQDEDQTEPVLQILISN